jgi:uncharacterized membrane protein
MDSGRLEAFSDGVFAVAITLLALNLAVHGPDPKYTLNSSLAQHWPAYVAYAVSFGAIGVIWVNHHSVFRHVTEIDRPILYLNLLLLFFVVAIPFATGTVADYLRFPGATTAAVLYQCVFEGMSLAFGLLFWRVVKCGRLSVPLTAADQKRAFIRFSIGNLGYLAAIGVAFLSAPASLIIAGLVAVYYTFEQTPVAARTTAAPDPETGPDPDPDDDA